jgi:YfiH family protein
MRILKSRLLGEFPHGFTTRDGGASRAPFDALNLGGAVGDDPAAVTENWARLERETGLRFARVRQVHGARVVRAAAPTGPAEEADAVVTAAPGVAACVSVADCVPILLADPVGGAVAAVHAGWRGTVARAAAEAIRALSAEGADPARLIAAVGPSIGPCCYEVSPDLAERFAREIGPEAVAPGASGPHLDLWRSNVLVLRDAGVAPERVEVLGRCTACERDLFFSHRRDAGRTGRQVGFVSPRTIAHPRLGGEGPLP